MTVGRSLAGALTTAFAHPFKATAANPNKKKRYSILLNRLQIFLCPSIHSLKCLFDIFDGVGHAEAQVAFAEIAEGGP